VIPIAAGDTPNLYTAEPYLLVADVPSAAAVMLAHRGVAVHPFAMTLTVAIAFGARSFEPRYSLLLAMAWSYAALIAVLGGVSVPVAGDRGSATLGLRVAGE
jgi:hypothetical protein